MPTKSRPESCDLVNKNTNKLGKKSECQPANISSSRIVQSCGGRFQREPLPSDLTCVSQWFSKCGSGTVTLVSLGNFWEWNLKVLSQICPPKVRLENYAPSLGELERIQQHRRQYRHTWHTGLTFVFLEVGNSGGTDAQAKLICLDIKSSQYLHNWKVT